MERYKLQYLTRNRELVAVHQVCDSGNREFYIWAIKEGTNAEDHDKKHMQRHEYTEPMTLEEAKAFVTKNNGIVGHRDCKGLSLEDECLILDFEGKYHEQKSKKPEESGSYDKLIEKISEAAADSFFGIRR